MILLQHGRAEWNSIRKTITSRNRIDGMPTEFEWKTFSGITTLGLLEKIQSPMCNDIAWREKGNTETCEYNSQTVAEYARKFPRGHWYFLEHGSEKKWYGTYTDKPDGSWDRMAEEMMAIFSRSGHPTFRASSAFERGELRSKEGRKKSTYTSTVVMKTSNCFSERWVISANQLSVYGAIADLCSELSKDLRAPGKPEAPDHLETMEILLARLLQKLMPMHSNGETLCKNTSDNSNTCQKTRNYTNYVLMRFWSLSKRTILQNPWYRRRTTDATFMPRIHDASEWKRELVWEDGSARIQESVQSWT